MVMVGLRRWMTRGAAASALALALTLGGGPLPGGEAMAEKKQTQSNSIKDDCEAVGGTYRESKRGHKTCSGIPFRDNNGNETGDKWGFGCTPSAIMVTDCTPTGLPND